MPLSPIHGSAIGDDSYDDDDDDDDEDDEVLTAVVDVLQSVVNQEEVGRRHSRRNLHRKHLPISTARKDANDAGATTWPIHTAVGTLTHSLNVVRRSASPSQNLNPGRPVHITHTVQRLRRRKAYNKLHRFTERDSIGSHSILQYLGVWGFS